jgi:hypothetical protein
VIELVVSRSVAIRHPPILDVDDDPAHAGDHLRSMSSWAPCRAI